MRTGDKRVDSVCITAHDKFDEIVAEANSQSSIFHSGGIIYADYLERQRTATGQTRLFDTNETRQRVFEAGGMDVNDPTLTNAFQQIQSALVENTSRHIREQGKVNAKVRKEIIAETRKDLGETFKENADLTRLLEISFGLVGDEIVEQAERKTMYIPKIRTENFSGERYIIEDFDLDMSQMSYVPIKNDILIRNLLDSREEIDIIKGSVIDFEAVNPEKAMVDSLREISEIDYEKCPELIQKLVMQFLNFYRSKYKEEEVRNIVLMYRKDIRNHFRDQLLQHLAIKYDNIFEEVAGIETVVSNYLTGYTGTPKNINDGPETGENISSIAYTGTRKSINEPVKFDSDPERLFALACENSPEVIQWLRPGPDQFNITYNRGHRYEPDFVVETVDQYYLVEVKARNKMNDPDVLAKKERAIKYCRVATEYNVAHGHKGFKYLFIPHDEIRGNSSFNNLKNRFTQENE